MNIKVLHFIWSANFGGIEKLVIYLVREQMRDPEVEPFLLIGCKKGELVKQISEFKINHQYSGLKSGFDLNFSTYHRLKKMMTEFDIIHIHTFNPLISLAALNSGSRVIYTIHGNFNLGRRIRWNDKVLNRLRKWFMNKKDTMITFNSKWSKETAEEKFGLSENKKEIVYNGFIPELSNHHSSAASEITELINKNDFVVGTACRFNEGKRTDRLIDGFAKFSAHKEDVKLLLVGDGVMRKSLENQVNELGINSKTIFTGYRDNVNSYQSLMNVSVIPSQYESFGLTALETMKLGIPTIMFTDAGGMLEIPGDEFRDDILENTDQLAQRLEYYYNNRHRPNQKLTDLRKERAALFSFDKMAESYKKCYRDMLNVTSSSTSGNRAIIS